LWCLTSIFLSKYIQLTKQTMTCFYFDAIPCQTYYSS
jgi:hypothetical protein